MCGSPPRVWGNRCCGRGRIGSCRFTPTRVGKSPTPPAPTTRCSVHPHACGEIAVCFARSSRMSGSPPRVWGNPCTLMVWDLAHRFTPTRVGKSSANRATGDCRSVHPHACGEIGLWIRLGRFEPGSPPRVWGNHAHIPGRIRRQRFTPTRVGKSRSHSRTHPSPAVHPHACGEIQAVRINWEGGVGSPPRVWGNLAGLDQAHLQRRFTPTRVGKSRRGLADAPDAAVHPHACGEITSLDRNCKCTFGSPPRVWGNLRGLRILRCRLRFTPTRVGKSLTGYTGRA